MTPRDPKKTLPPRARRSTTRRDLAASTERVGMFKPVIDDEDREPVLNTRPTQRDIESPFSSRLTRREMAVPGFEDKVGPERGRGQYSISTVRGITVDSISGSIDTTERKRRRTGSIAVPQVHLAGVTKKDITVIIREQSLTLSREDALLLASIITTALA